jgi:hypothetical protein
MYFIIIKYMSVENFSLFYFTRRTLILNDFRFLTQHMVISIDGFGNSRDKEH